MKGVDTVHGCSVRFRLRLEQVDLLARLDVSSYACACVELWGFSRKSQKHSQQ